MAHFELKSGNKSPLEFKLMGSSPIRQGLTDEKVVNVSDISDYKSELLHRKQIAAAKKEYRSNMPIVHKGDKNSKKRNKFIADYMSKFEPPAYTPPEKKVITTSSTTPKVKPKPTTTTYKAPQGDELTQYFHGTKSANIDSGLGYGEHGTNPGLSEERQTEIGNWINAGGQYSGKAGPVDPNISKDIIALTKNIK